jgi:hypothetical protein
MKTLLLPLAALFALSSGVALGAGPQPGSDARSACQADVQKLCSGVQPGKHRIVSCLKENEANVSPACKEALAARQRQLPAPPDKAPQS